MWSYEIPRPEGSYYSPREVARILNVSVDVIYLWIEERKVATLKIFYRKRTYHWIPEEELERLKNVKVPKCKMLTVREASEVLDTRHETVLQMIHSGKLHAVKVGLYYKIPETEILKLKTNGGVSNGHSSEA